MSEENTLCVLDKLSKVVQLSADASSGATWLGELIEDHLQKGTVADVAELNAEQQQALLDAVVKSFDENGYALPEYLTESGITTTDETVVDPTSEELAEETKEDEDGETVIAETTGDEEIQTAVKAESAKVKALRKKLEVAKTFVQSLDDKVTKYEAAESEKIQELTARLKKYEALGTVEGIQGLLNDINKLEKDLKTKQEAAKNEEIVEDDLDSDSEDGSDVNSKDPEDSKETPEEKSDEDSEDKSESETPEGEEMTTEVDDIKKLLDRYQALGTPEEIEQLMKKADEFHETTQELTEKVESFQKDAALLDKYESIGEPQEIIAVLQEYSGLRTKHEAQRIAKKLRIPVEKVENTIAKMESVSEAENLLADLFSKNESEVDEVTGTSEEELGDTEELADEQPTSPEGDEPAEEESESEEDTAEEGKEKSEARMTVLKKLMLKI